MDYLNLTPAKPPTMNIFRAQSGAFSVQTRPFAKSRKCMSHNNLMNSCLQTQTAGCDTSSKADQSQSGSCRSPSKKFKDPPTGFSIKQLSSVYDAPKEKILFENQDMLRDSLKAFSKDFNTSQKHQMIKFSENGQYDQMKSYSKQEIGLS